MQKNPYVILGVDENVSDDQLYEAYRKKRAEYADARYAKFQMRSLEDVDRRIAATAGRPIPEIFAQEGEEGFRIREHLALCAVSKESGRVIACGGGIVTRKENWDPMRQNSTVIYLRRDLSLLPTSGRPMSQANPVEKLYRQRAPLYEQLADLTVENRGTPAETANEIIRRLGL